MWHRVLRLLQTPTREPLGEEGPPLLGQNIHLFWMQPGGCSCFWPQHGFKVMKLRGKGIVYALGFQKLKNRAFSPSLKASQKEYSTSNKIAARESSRRPATAAGLHSGWWPGPFSHRGAHGAAEGPAQLSHGQADHWGCLILGSSMPGCMGEVELIFVKESNKLRAKEPEINLEGRDGARVKLNERQLMISTTSTAKNTFHFISAN